jgi:hypothetical protein
MHLSGVPPLQFRLHTHLLGDTHRMSDREWAQVRAEQLRRYYRPISQPAPVPEIIPPAKVVPYQPPRQEVIPPSGAVRRKRTFKPERVEITEEDEGII